MLLFLITTTNLFAQTSPVTINIPEVTVVDIEPSNSPISLNLEIPSESGTSLSNSVEDQSKWINYTCALSDNSSTRNIYMQISSGTIPSGLSLNLTIGSAVGGAGNLGNSSGTIELSNQPKLIISGIGRGYTGNGAGAGHPLTYKLNIKDYGLLDADQSSSVQVMITITE